MRSLTLAGLLGCGLFAGAGAAWAAATAERVVVQLPYSPQFQFAGFYAAQAQGFFRAAGLTVELRTGDTQHRPVDEVLAGRADYGVTGNSLLLGRLRGEPLVAVMVIFQHSPFVLLARPGVGTPADLMGRRVTADPADRFPELPAMFAAEGIKPDQLEVGPQRWDALTLVDSGVDAMGGFSTATPYDLEREGVKFRVMRPADYGVDFYGDTLFTTEAEARRHPERVVALRHALRLGWEYAVEHRAEMIDWILRERPDRPARVTRARLEFEAAETVRLINADLVEVGHMNPGRWQRMAETLVQLGLVPDTRRLAGFLFREPVESWRVIGWWLGGGLAIATAVTLLAVLANARLKKLVEARTRELQRSEAAQRELFDQAPVPIVVESYVELAAKLEEFRAAGVTDLRGHLAARPELVRELHGLKRVVAVNARALARTNFKSLEETNRRLAEIVTPQALEMFIEELVAIWEERDTLAMEKTYNLQNGETAQVLVNWSVDRRDGRRDLARVRLVFTDITELKRAEAALRLSEERYRQLFELSPVAMVEFDYQAVPGWFRQLRAAGVTDLGAHLEAHPELLPLVLKYSPLVQGNLAAVQLSGARSKEELQDRLAEFFTPEALAERGRNLARLWAGEDHAAGEVPLRSLAGEVRYFHYFWRMSRDGGELSFTRTQTALVDITDQHRAKQALGESEERYRSLFEVTPNPMYIFDLDTLAFVAVNDAAVRKYGYTREEFLAMNILQIRPPAEAERLQREMPRYTDGGELVPQVWLHRLKDGTTINVEVSTRVLVLGGRRSVLVVPFDITERMAAERALRESEARYRELFEKAPVGVYRSSADGLFLAANPALATMLGFATPQELLDMDSSNRGAPLYVQSTRRAEFQAAIKDTGHAENFESEVRCKDGTTIWISENVRQVRDSGGRILYHEGFVSDITPRRRLEGEMLRASKLEAVGILAGGIAHDFNNILTVVLGNITLAEMDSGAQGAVVPLLRDAKRATLRARDLTQQLLTFAKGGNPVRSAVNLPELLSESTGFAMHGAKARRGHRARAPRQDFRPVFHHQTAGQRARVGDGLLDREKTPGAHRSGVAARRRHAVPPLVARRRGRRDSLRQPARRRGEAEGARALHGRRARHPQHGRHVPRPARHRLRARRRRRRRRDEIQGGPRRRPPLRSGHHRPHRARRHGRARGDGTVAGLRPAGEGDRLQRLFARPGARQLPGPRLLRHPAQTLQPRPTARGAAGIRRGVILR
ncbi:MAG: PAS domain S-box protein [Opitutae bacterium]|nr:PAS domain S-box protein [Opitutae bacterium]